MKINELVLSQTLKARGVHGPRFEWSQGRKGWVYLVDCQKKKKITEPLLLLFLRDT